ncbi:MAG: LTA synthase family protein [Oligoflexales bacterium]
MKFTVKHRILTVGLLALSFLYFRMAALADLNPATAQPFLVKWLFGLALDLSVLTLAAFVLDYSRETRGRMAAKVLLTVLFLYNLLNYHAVYLINSHLSLKVFDYFSVVDILNPISVGLTKSSLKFFPTLFIFVIPVFGLYCGTPTYPKLSRRHLWYGLPIVLLGAGLFSSYGLYRKHMPSGFDYLRKDAYFNGVEDSVEFITSGSKSPERKYDKIRIAKTIRDLYGKDAKWVFPFPEFPMFKMGRYEHCLWENGKTSADTACKNLEKTVLHPKKNVILITLESFRAISVDHLSPFWKGITPKFSKWATKGASFSHAFANDAPTDRAIAALLCSTPGTKKALTQITEPVPENICLPDILKAMGYRTMRFAGTDPHFARMGGFYSEHSMKGLSGEALASVFGIPKSTWGLDWLYLNDGQLFDLGRKWVEGHREENSESPFFAVIETMNSHTPFVVPPLKKYRNLKVPGEGFGSEKELTTNLHRTMRYVDDELDKFLSWVYSPASGLADNTIVAIIADHPPFHNEHEYATIPQRLVRSWIPFVILGVPETRIGTQDIPAGSVDLAPTLLGLLGSYAPNSFVGRDLFALDTNFVVQKPERVFVTDDVIYMRRRWHKSSYFDLKEMNSVNLTREQEARAKAYRKEIRYFYRYGADLLSKERRTIPRSLTNAELLRLY